MPRKPEHRRGVGSRAVRRRAQAPPSPARSGWLWLFANFGLGVAGAGCLLTVPPPRRRA